MVSLLSLLPAHTDRHTAAALSRCSAGHIATTGGNNRCSQRLPHSLQSPEPQELHCQGPPSRLNTSSGLERPHHQGLADLISGRKIINKESDLSHKMNKKAEQAAGTSNLIKPPVEDTTQRDI